VQEWLLYPDHRGLLIHSNCRRHESISPASVACAMLIHIFSEKLPFATLYWFCGSHIKGPNGNPLGMMRNLICQLLCSSRGECSPEDLKDFDGQDLDKMLDLFTRLLQRSSDLIPVVCILDGISYYEGQHQSDHTCSIVHKLAKIAKSDSPVLKLLITSPQRTSHVHRERKVADNLTVVEIPLHVNGAKQGLNHREVVSSTERRARTMSESLGTGQKRT